MKLSVVRCATVLVAILAAPGAVTVHAGTPHRHTEDFTTAQFEDTAQTTAWWNTNAGRVQLYPFQAARVGAYDTPFYSRDVVVSGGIAYVADVNAGVQIIDVADPAAPEPIAAFAPATTASDVYVYGKRLFVADGTGGLRILDISDPSAPFQVGRLLTPDYARGVTVEGHLAFVEDAGFGLLIVDVSHPGQPRVLSTVELPDFAVDATIVGHTLFVAGGPGGMHVLDVSDPSRPGTPVTFSTRGSYNRQIAVSGNYAFLSAAQSGLVVADITNPMNPVRVGGYDTPTYAFGVVVDGPYAYVADGITGIVVLDVSDPTHPVHVTSIDTPGESIKCYLFGDHVYAADGPAGLQAIRVRDAATPATLGAYVSETAGLGLAVDGSRSYVLDTDGVKSIDIGDPRSPQEVGSMAMPLSGPGDMALVGDYLYAAASPVGLMALSIADASVPVLLDSVTLPGAGHAVAVQGDYAFIAGGSGGLVVTDISDPTSLAVAATLPLPGESEAIAVAGDLAYLSGNGGGLTVVDIGDPLWPVVAGALTGADAHDIALYGGLAYMASDTRVLVADVHDATSPVVVDSITDLSSVGRVVASGDHLIAGETGSTENHLWLFEMRNPRQPVFLGAVALADGGEAVASGDVVHVVGSSGMTCLQVHQRDVDTRRKFAQSLPLSESGADIITARLTATQTAGVSWQLSTDGGTNWDPAPVNAWVTPSARGPDMSWRATLAYNGPGSDPVCTRVELDWRYEFAVIDSIADVPADKGGWATVYFTRSAYDFAEEMTAPITTYAVYRRPEGTRPRIWEQVASVPAQQQEEYSVPVPTVADSADSIIYSAYYVSAKTSDPGMFFDSPPDSGYSVDNTGEQTAVTIGEFGAEYVSGTVMVHWVVHDADHLAGFNLYRLSALAATQTRLNSKLLPAGQTSFRDEDVESGETYRYRLGVVDRDGEFFSQVRTVTAPPPSVYLLQNYPNPFQPSTTIEFGAGSQGIATIRIYDVAGRLVRTLIEADEVPPGNQRVTWDGTDDAGHRVGSGVYFYRLSVGAETRVRRMVLLE